MHLILDTETTGVTPTARIVSLAWALYDDAEVEVSNAHHVIRPDGFTIPPDATAVHGITTAEARRKGIPIGDALTGLSNDIARHAHLFGRSHTQAHDARADVLACARCFYELRRRGLGGDR